MSDHDHTLDKHEAHKGVEPHLYANEHVDEEVGVVKKGDPLHKDLKSRHMQMIAIGMNLAFRLGNVESQCLIMNCF